ncbi:AP-1 complex subunit gamma-1 [Sphaceloma murrayae]|uniref:AP-1 complex subunit gamma-1 n=1 Tax=Sphaceloma murrayae TaxID=2082308 RepID=A0A2K1QFX5_9PEZI|nr:AP-1 complex subunit gamma-1 [Sphaceloma murrayae]
METSTVTAGFSRFTGKQQHIRPTEAENFRHLDEALSDHPLQDSPARNKLIGHQLLGQIWQSLGRMIIEDKRHQQTVSPGILEIIAILHSRNVMPSSIYSYEPHLSSVAGTQPPTLHILSQQILTTLSDAVWKAREASAVEQADRSGRPAIFMGPELPGSNYRVRVAGIRHEIWLELVLWSCLHGGWIRPGAAILGQIYREEKPLWSPLSWREITEPLVKAGEEENIDWIAVNYQFNIGAGPRHIQAHGQPVKVDSTISSEVISAYVDALVNQVSVGVGERGVPLAEIIDLLDRTKKFLQRKNFSLESTSWDAMVQRVIESESLDVESAPVLTERILQLSSSYGEDETSRNTPTRDEAWRPRALYLLDGSALSLGVTHRVLHAYIKRGDFAGAFRTFKSLQARTDQNKRNSIATFFREFKAKEQSGSVNDIDFSSPYSQANFPGLFTMLPVRVLATFLDLITEVEAFSFGRWLLASHDVDGPVVGQHAYRDPEMAPAIIRFLAASRDEQLLGEMLQQMQANRDQSLPSSVFIAILESQFRLGNAQAGLAPVEGLLGAEETTAEQRQTVIALLARETLLPTSEGTSFKTKLQQILRGATETAMSIRTSFAVLLMSIDDELGRLCLDCIRLSPRIRFAMDVRPFNIVLEGCVAKYGSEGGRALLCKFSRLADQVTMEPIPADEDAPGIIRVLGRIRPGSVRVARDDVIDFAISVPFDQQKDNQPAQIEVHGHFQPDISTVRIILTQRLRELRQVRVKGSDTATPIGFGDDIVEWCAALLRVLGMKVKDVEQEIEGQYTEVKVEDDA